MNPEKSWSRDSTWDLQIATYLKLQEEKVKIFSHSSDTGWERLKVTFTLS